MKANEYAVLRMAVEAGVRMGWARAHKHVEHPTENAICDTVEDEVLNAICEWFDFEQAEDDNG